MDTTSAHERASVPAAAATAQAAAPVAAQRWVAVALAALLAAAALVVAGASPAQAAARLSASSSLGGTVASTSGPTTFTVSGSGFQAVQGGFGGIYVGFGWVNGSNWGPSKGGATGSSYDYVPDDQSKNNKGYQAFVAFPGSETSGEAQGTMGADGSFRLQLTVPGPTFTGAGGKRIDCLQVTCGFFTWGAHGVRNGANETFTPVTFQGGAAPAADEAAAPVGGAPAARAESGAQPGRAAAAGRAQGRSSAPRSQGAAPAPRSSDSGPSDSGSTAGGEAGGGDDSVSAENDAGDGPVDATGGTRLSGAAVVEVDRKSARPGGAMGFAAAGFWPGEQVYVVLGEGEAAVGPVIAGVDGEVAGVIVLPEDLEPGTHEIRAAGAGSALEATERFPVRVDIATASSSSSGFAGSLKWIFLALSALALLAMAAVVVRHRQAAAGAEGADDNDDDGDDDDNDDDNNGGGPDAFTGPEAFIGPDPRTSSKPGPASGAEPLPYTDSTATPFPHPAMTGGASTTTTAFEKKDLR